MNTERLQKLLKFLDEDPNDPFTLYAIALEYTALEKEKAKFYFEQLLQSHDQYLPTYYHAGQFYAENGDLSTAKDILEKGIQLARKQSEEQTEKELSNLLQNLLFEED